MSETLPKPPVRLPLQQPQLLEMARDCTSEGNRFLKLPPELRNAIYDLLLPSTQQVVIFSRQNRKASYGHYPNALEQKGYFQFASTCHQIYDECMKIFYGRLQFTAFAGASFGHWIDDIGSLKQHVRQISLSVDWPRFVKNGLGHLRRVISLRCLKLWDAVRSTASPATLAKDLKPLLEGIAGDMRKHGEGGGRGYVVDIVHFPPKIEQSEVKNANAQFNAEVVQAAERLDTEPYASDFREEMSKILLLRGS